MCSVFFWTSTLWNRMHTPGVTHLCDILYDTAAIKAVHRSRRTYYHYVLVKMISRENVYGYVFPDAWSAHKIRLVMYPITVFYFITVVRPFHTVYIHLHCQSMRYLKLWFKGNGLNSLENAIDDHWNSVITYISVMNLHNLKWTFLARFENNGGFMKLNRERQNVLPK